jgi:GNAT superfamily N-acetyltransferase
VTTTTERPSDPDHPGAARLPGELTLLGSWRALARESREAHLTCTPAGLAAVFPHCAPLNNAVLRGPATRATASAAVVELQAVYTAAGVESWALWLPSPATTFDAPDSVAAVEGMTRDTTTLVMTLDVPAGLPADPAVVRTTVTTAERATEEPVPVDQLPGPPNAVDAVQGWVLTLDEVAIAGAWTYRNGTDVGVYAVGTTPDRRRRGHARTLILHVLAEARRHGVRTASLQSTRMGRRLYESLGFRAVGRYDEWVRR